MLAKGFGQADNESEPAESEYVYFHSGSKPEYKSPFDWGGIRFFEGSDDSVLKHVKIEDAKVGISIYKSSPTISKVAFDNIGDQAIYVSSEEYDLNIPDFIKIITPSVDTDTLLMPNERYTFRVDINYTLTSIIDPSQVGAIEYWIMTDNGEYLFYQEYLVDPGMSIDRIIVPDPVVIPYGTRNIYAMVFLYDKQWNFYDEVEQVRLSDDLIEYEVYRPPVEENVEIYGVVPETDFVTPGTGFSADVLVHLAISEDEARFLEYRVETNTGLPLFEFNRIPLYPGSTAHQWTVSVAELPSGYEYIDIIVGLYTYPQYIEGEVPISSDFRRYYFLSEEQPRRSLPDIEKYLLKLNKNAFSIPEPLIESCVLRGNAFGIYSKDSSPVLKGNDFERYIRAGVYIRGSHVPNIGTINIADGSIDGGGNSFNYGSGQYTIWNDSENPIRAHRNYWGNTDLFDINESIFDQHENVYSGPVEITEYLTGTLSKLVAGDLNKDFEVNAGDLLDIFYRWHKVIGDPDFKTTSDLNYDYTINYKDLFILTEILTVK